MQLRFPGTPDGFEQGFVRLCRALDDEHLKLAARTRYNIELVFEEIVGNIVRYGAPRGGELHIDVSMEIGGNRIKIAFEDDGIPFDPCGLGDAPALKTLSDAPDGGFGLKLVRHAANSMQYERTARQRNRLVVTLEHC